MTPTTAGAGPVPPDTKDWTWVLDRPCPECGFDAEGVRREEVGDRVNANASAWQRVLSLPGARTRPSATVWSPLEYACHVRDVHRIFGERVRMMLTVDNPLFDNWDQDEAAVRGAYGAQDPATVSAELVAAATGVSRGYAAVEEGHWSRPGRRSNGSLFTVETIARYHLHDVEHHLRDVS